MNIIFVNNNGYTCTANQLLFSHYCYDYVDNNHYLAYDYRNYANPGYISAWIQYNAAGSDAVSCDSTIMIYHPTTSCFAMCAHCEPVEDEVNEVYKNCFGNYPADDPKLVSWTCAEDAYVFLSCNRAIAVISNLYMTETESTMYCINWTYRWQD